MSRQQPFLREYRVPRCEVSLEQEPRIAETFVAYQSGPRTQKAPPKASLKLQQSTEWLEEQLLAMSRKQRVDVERRVLELH